MLLLAKEVVRYTKRLSELQKGGQRHVKATKILRGGQIYVKAVRNTER